MIENYDKKIRLVVGELMAKADTPTKSVLTAYDPSKDRTTNRTVLGGSKFQVSTPDACANLFKIATIDENGSRIYRNKPSLAMRIILEIETLFPAICGQCDEEYCNKFDSPTSLHCNASCVSKALTVVNKRLKLQLISTQSQQRYLMVLCGSANSA